jgi:NADPH:quinone reductase-like Zn-dependent oxidoreductase
LYFGAAKVYTTAILKHHALLRSQGAIPVDASPDTIWCEQIDSHIDLAISNHSLANIYDVMKFGGKIVFLGEGTTKLVGVSGSISDFIFLRIRGLSTFTYDMFYEWENDMERSKKDLSYLFGLLMLNRITPQVTRTMGLKNVPKAHVYLDSKKRVQGTMVCLPSNDDNLRLALSGEV